MKKAQGMPLQTIIIAILCLLVLVVLIAIFTGKIKGWSENSGTCIAVGGKVVKTGTCSISNGDIPLGRNFREFTQGDEAANKDYAEENVCCKKKLPKPPSA